MAAACFLFTVPFYGQSTADKYLISAEAGGVGAIDGEVNISRAGGTGGVLVVGDKVKTGERVTTGEDSRAEILLNPGSYLRLSENSAFRFRSTSLDNLRITLEKGSAIFEVLATNQFRVSVYTPKSRITMVQTGVFRVDLTPDGNGALSVIEGQAIIGDTNPFILKEGKQGNLDGAPVVATKFDRGKGDLFSMWSKDRSKQLAKVAKAFNAKTLRNSLIGYTAMFCRIGVWAFHPQLGTGFVPCYDGFSNPYGYGYGRSIWGYNPWDRNPYDNGGYTNSSNSGTFKSGSVTSGSASPSIPMSAPAPSAPPVSTTKSSPGVVDH